MNLFRPVGDVVEAAQWNGSNEAEVRDLLGDDRPFPRLGFFVVRRNGGIEILHPEDFTYRYEPI